MRDENRVGSVAAVTETSVAENTRSVDRCGENDVVACVLERSEEASVAEVSTDELPVKGVDVILGNDLCGMRVRPDDPIVSMTPIVETSTNVLESELPYVFPLCAMTRSKDGVISRVKPKDVKEPSNGNRVNASQELGDDGDMNDLSDTFFAKFDDVSELPDKGANGLTELQLHDEECKDLAASAPFIQPTLRDVISKREVYKEEDHKKKQLDDLVAKMIVKDLQPLSVVEDEGFRELVQSILCRVTENW
ncbi:hypothetical protein Pcinc_010612 [Petrolisthes cinctipes]|uniref:Uncharacterized protein n=1 Tax=Petrolisthes cinctipes TaxID=88211 RepID=A0AAE1KX73_PETCI|nr:hypothetical protein Pcinc_010612 [Petrolisthes cinctipes]